MSKNIDTLISEALSIESRDAKEAGALGYMARALVQATLPYTKTIGNEFKRRNGAFKLTVLADSEIGLPYGSIPRLLLAWLTTEAVRTKKREIVLGKSLTNFMAQLDLIPTGGRWGTITRLREQMKRLFSASISCTYDNGDNWSIKNVTPISRATLWWDPKRHNQTTLFDSTIILGEDFFNEIIKYPVPIDMDALKALKKSPMALDIYCWLTYRMSYIAKESIIPWAALRVQFGANYAQNPQGLRDFKRAFLRELKKVRLVYPMVSVEEAQETLTLFPGKSHIKSSQKQPSFLLKKKPKSTINHTKEDVSKKYTEYKLNYVIELISKSVDKYKIISDFEKSRTRRGLEKNIKKILSGDCSFGDKEDLYYFIDKHWHYLLEDIKTYQEFEKSK